MTRRGDTTEALLPALSLVAVRKEIALSELAGAVAPMFEDMTAKISAAGYAFFGPSVGLYSLRDDVMICVVGVELSQDIPGLERIDVPATRALVERHVLGMSDFTPAHDALHATALARGAVPGTWGREVYRAFHPGEERFECDIMLDIAD